MRSFFWCFAFSTVAADVCEVDDTMSALQNTFRAKAKQHRAACKLVQAGQKAPFDVLFTADDGSKVDHSTKSGEVAVSAGRFCVDGRNVALTQREWIDNSDYWFWWPSEWMWMDNSEPLMESRTVPGSGRPGGPHGEPPPPPRTKTKCSVQHEDRLFRTPLSGMSSSITFVECVVECQRTKGCIHFSWGEFDGGSVCMGCTSLAKEEHHVGFTTYDLPQHAETKCSVQHEDRLFRAPPLSGMSSITLEACLAQCQSTKGCIHDSWGEFEGGSVCMGCTSLANSEHAGGFTTYDLR